MTKRKLLILIPAAAILLNGLGYLIVTRVRAPAPLSARTPAAAGTTTTTETNPSNQPTQAAGEDNSEGAKTKEKLALLRRANGLTALEAGDYDKALINFTEARALLGDKANVGDLLRVAEQLRRRPTSPSRPRANVAPPVVVASRPVPRPTTRRVAVKEEPSPEIVAQQPSGLLIVSTTPRSLLVQIDDTAMDLTPMRTRVKAGGHRIALLDGERRVYETTIEIKDGGTATLIKDLSRELAAESAAPEPPRVPTAVAAPAPAPDEQPTSRVTEPPDLQPAARQPNPVGATPVARARGTTGALQVTSPGLYGVVWINGRPRGYPPIEVRDLPAGPVKIEVRVNGIQKRTSTVDVVPGLTTAVKLR